ncbi:MAG: hypothetical protein WC120_00875 [Parcubacteria group bacterium]
MRKKLELFLWAVIWLSLGGILEKMGNGPRVIPFQISPNSVCFIPSDAEVVEVEHSLDGCYYYSDGKRYFSAGYGDAETSGRGKGFDIALRR